MPFLPELELGLVAVETGAQEAITQQSMCVCVGLHARMRVS